MKTMVYSVANFADSEAVKREALSSDALRQKTLDECFRIPGFAYLPLAKKNEVYDQVKAKFSK